MTKIVWGVGGAYMFMSDLGFLRIDYVGLR